MKKSEIYVPFVPTPPRVVGCMLDMANVGRGDMVCDLGFGDGRILVAAASPPYNAKAVGVEHDKKRFHDAKRLVKHLGLEKSIELLYGDIMDFDVGDATVVTAYLLPNANDAVKPKLEKELDTSARIVSHDYQFYGWKPSKKQELIVPTPWTFSYVPGSDKDAFGISHHYVYLYEMSKIR
ncbi:MAG: class I SAM-dependent methyltransferase [Candidatus Aenigmarchaeota archaeon]|nr:class I SAM-dependent methyltransferase [Candidatus Aenigmarchaeota archaeon]